MQGIDSGGQGSSHLTIPEPGTILLFAAGLTAPLMSRLRRRT
ncbi:MAG: PEP-CTERM sorting domain-containing protein [Chthonomonadetes bacterium]|nr:PEP-CTERM sorting domain-containing protein [Chthonomonadetes bacterium]